MKSSTAYRVAEAIQILMLDGFEKYTLAQISQASGVSIKTLRRNEDLVLMLDFALSTKRYHKCII